MPSNFTTPFIPAPESAGFAVTAGTDSTSSVTPTIRIKKKEASEVKRNCSIFIFKHHFLYNKVSRSICPGIEICSSLPSMIILQLCMFLRIAQGADVVHYIPSLLRRHRGHERRHWSAVESCFEITKHVPICVSAFELSTAGEIEGCDRITLAVGQRGRRRSVAASIFSMTLPAIHGLEESRSALHAFGRVCRLNRNWRDFAWFLFFKCRGKRLDISDQISAFLPQQRLP